MESSFTSELLNGLRHETPFFLFSREKIKQKYEEFNSFFPNAGIHYAIKANSEPEVISLLREMGSGFEAASVYELNILKEAGVPPQKIIYGTSVKPASHIKEFFDYGVCCFACDSWSELEKIAANAPGSSVYIRVAVNDTGSVFKFSEKFGTDINNVVPLLLRAQELGLVPYGISFHVGSQASNPKAWANALESLTPVLEELKKASIDIEIINIGGGYPSVYASTETELLLKEIAHEIEIAYKNLPYQPKLLLEPGRGIIAEAGILVTEIIGRVERAGNTWLFLDAGVYNALFESMAYQGSTRYKITSLRSSYDAGESLFSLAGPTGDSPDVLTREALLPTDMSVGDKLVFHNAGAYTVAVTSRFNGFPKPAVYFV